MSLLSLSLLSSNLKFDQIRNERENENRMMMERVRMEVKEGGKDLVISKRLHELLEVN